MPSYNIVFCNSDYWCIRYHVSNMLLIDPVIYYECNVIDCVWLHILTVGAIRNVILMTFIGLLYKRIRTHILSP